MAELRGRSRRLRKRSNTSQPGSSPSPSQRTSALRRRQPTSSSRPRSRQDAQNSQGDRPQSHGLVSNSSGAIVQASSRYQRRDGRRTALNPDASRRRRQVGAYAPAFNGRQPGGQLDPRRNPTAEANTAIIRPLPRRQDTPPRFPNSHPADAYRPVQRLDPRPIGQSPSRKRAVPRTRKPPKPTPPIVYAVRLLILGIGMGAIAGTIISAVDPSQRDAAMSASDDGVVTANGELIDNTSGGALPSSLSVPESGRSLATPLHLGQEMIPLFTKLQTMVNTQTDLNPGVFLYDLDTTNYLSLNGDSAFSAASTIKVPVLVAFFQDVEAGRINLDDVLTMRENDVASGSGDMQFQPVGTEYTAMETATKMIIISDNTATNMLIRKLGGAHALNRRFQSWGLTSTAIRNPLPDLEGTNTTSPRDLVTLMTLISHGELLSMRSRDQMLHIMERTRTNTLLPQGIGPGAQIAHKTGDIGSMVGDVGLIDMPDGKRYGITVLVQRPHNDPRAQQLIRQISTEVYDTLEAGEELEQLPTNPVSPDDALSNTTSESDPATDVPASDPEAENPEFFGIQ